METDSKHVAKMCAFMQAVICDILLLAEDSTGEPDGAKASLDRRRTI